MATGRMVKMVTGELSCHSMLAALACLSMPAIGLADVGLAGLTSSKAMLVVDSGEPQTLAVGQSLGGIKLLSIHGDQVIIEVDGKKRSLRVGQHAMGSEAGDSAARVVLTADSQGHFLTTGTVNGKSVKFLVDTGATLISLGAGDARRIGLDIGGQNGTTVNTANGQAQVSRIKLDTVRIGDIVLYNVDALIHQQELPMALLGMSFLNRMEMQRDGDTMTLKKRY